MWTPNPFPIKLADIPLGNETPPFTLRVEVGPRLPIPGWPSATFQVWTETPKGEKVNMPFIAQVSEKQPWILFNIPYVPPGVNQLAVKAKMFPTAFMVKQTRLEKGTATTPAPEGWIPPKSPGERMQDIQRSLGTGLIAGGLASMLLIIAVIVAAIILVPKLLKYL